MGYSSKDLFDFLGGAQLYQSCSFFNIVQKGVWSNVKENLHKAEIYGADSFNKYLYHVVILTHPEAERAPCHTQWAELTGGGRCSL